MSGYKQLWDGATEKALAKSGEYLEKAKKLGTVNQREKEYIKAADGLFAGGVPRRTLRAAADHEDANDPGSFFPPAREMLGDLLLELRQPAQALAEYEAELKLSPNRFNGLFGAATAAHLSCDSNKPENYSATLREICGPKADREELHSGNLAALKNN